jgi:sporulation protein YlmC with PRC-barrel domain
MVTPYSKLIGTPVFELKTQRNLGTVIDVIINKNNFSVYGLLLKGSILPFGKTTVIAYSDILELTGSAIIVENEDAISDLKETVRLNEAYKSGYSGIGQRIVTKTGKKIGKVFDYLISSNDLTITRLYVKNLLNERIIPSSAIINIEGRKITINDSYELVDVRSTVIEAKMI